MFKKKRYTGMPVVKMKRMPVQIRTDWIKLDSLLKFTRMCFTGGHTKQLIREGQVKVNCEVCTERGRKIRYGDIVTLNGVEIDVAENI